MDGWRLTWYMKNAIEWDMAVITQATRMYPRRGKREWRLLMVLWKPVYEYMSVPYYHCQL